MRFSLATLLVVLLWLTVAIGVWFNSHLWIKSPKPLTLQEIRQIAPHWDEEAINEIYSIDGRSTRLIKGIKPHGWIELFDLLINEKTEHTLVTPVGFIDESTCAVAYIPYMAQFGNIELRTDTRFYIWSRRFPVQWWGHFYRPEVWALIGLTLVIAWRGVKRFRRLRATP